LKSTAEVEKTIELVLVPDSVHTLVDYARPASNIEELAAGTVKLVAVTAVQVSSTDAGRA